MNTTKAGKKAERLAAEHLRRNGYKILELNWRRPTCEIDIVASKRRKEGLLRREMVIYFVEVKYRSGSAAGSGLDYITPRKLAQMEKAARTWVQENGWQGSWELAAVEVGKNGELGLFVSNI